jgi:glucuronoarabinoxylan endo-1,4-beta-xylanase
VTARCTLSAPRIPIQEAGRLDATVRNMKNTILQIAVFALLVGSAWQRVAAATATVTVDYSKPKQTIEGFGAGIPWVAGNINNFSAADQTTILDALYSTTKPSAALSWVRVHTFMCQFNPSSGTYNFNDSSIQDEVSWVNRVKAAYGVTNVWASNWTPPAWMKSTGSCNGSNGAYLLPQYYPDFANDQVLWLQDWKAATGNAVNVLSLQNEPDQAPSYDGCTYTTDQINAATAYVRPAMTNAGLTTKYTVPEPAIYGGTSYYDSNWAIPILSNSSMDSYVDLMSTHGYGQLQNLSGPCTICQQYNKEIWQTEVMKSRGTWDPSITDAQKWTTSIYQALNQGHFSAWFYWWVFYNSNNNGFLIQYNSSTTPWTISSIPKRVYAMGNFSRFMRPGSTLLSSTSSSTALEPTAVKPTSGTVALVLSNTSSESITVTVTLSNVATPPTSVTPFRTSATENQVQLSPIPVSGGSFTITIPSASVVTLVG